MTCTRTTLVCIGLIALIVRAVFVLAVLKVSENEFRPQEGSDSPEYLQLARNFVERGRYTTDDPRSRLVGLYRTPAYPLYCAAIMKLGSGNRAILLSQAPIGAAIAVLVAWLAMVIFRSTALAWLAGLLSAFSPTGVGLTAMILVEVPFELMMVAGFCCALLAIQRRSAFAAICAGIAWAIGGLIKPSLLLWPFVGSVVWVLMARALSERVRWRDVTVCALIQLVAILGWSARNYFAENYFTFSAVGARNLRLLMIPMMEEWKKAGHQPTKADYYANYAALGDRQREYFHDHNASATEYLRTEMRESMQTIRRLPLLALRVYLFDLHDELISGWNLMDRRTYYDFSHAPRPQPASDPARRRKQRRAEAADDQARDQAAPIYWKIFKPLGWISMSPVCQWLWVLAASASAVTIGLHRDRAGWARRAWFVAALWVTVLYFAVFAGTVFRGGSRLMYPAEFAVILLLISNFANIFPLHAANASQEKI